MGDLGDTGDIASVALSPLGVEIAGGFGQQQVQVGDEDLFQETPGDERPDVAAVQIGKAGAVLAGPSTP